MGECHRDLTLARTDVTSILSVLGGLETVACV